MAQRKSKEEFRNEHEAFISLLKEQHPALAIMAKLSLSLVQFNKHMLTAYTKGEIEKSEWNPRYELVKAGALPKVIQEMLFSSSQAAQGNDVLIKVERYGDGLSLSPEKAALHASYSSLPEETVSG